MSPNAPLIRYSLLLSFSVLLCSSLVFFLVCWFFTSCVVRNKDKAVGDGADLQAGPGPVYDEVSPTFVKTEKFEMGENMAYGLTSVRRNVVNYN